MIRLLLLLIIIIKRKRWRKKEGLYYYYYYEMFTSYLSLLSCKTFHFFFFFHCLVYIRRPNKINAMQQPIVVYNDGLYILINPIFLLDHLNWDERKPRERKTDQQQQQNWRITFIERNSNEKITKPMWIEWVHGCT